MLVGVAILEPVVVIGRAVVGLLVAEPMIGIDEEAAMKIIEDDTVMLVAL